MNVCRVSDTRQNSKARYNTMVVAGLVSKTYTLLRYVV